MQYLYYYIIGGAALLLIIGLIVLAKLLKNRKLKKLGVYGEKKVSKKLHKFANIRSYKVIDDLYLPLYDKTTQIDHILIGFFGLIVFETKNMKGEIYGDPKKKEWLHIVGGKRENLYNPILQNQTHVDCIRHILGQEKIFNLTIDNIVVFANRKSVIYIPNSSPVIRIDDLKKFLKQKKYQNDKDVDVDLIYNTLMKYKLDNKKVANQHIKNVKEMAKNK